MIQGVGVWRQAWYPEPMDKTDYNAIRGRNEWINQILLSDEYDIKKTARKIVNDTPGSPEDLNCVCRAAMGMGHIALSQELIALGARPKNFDNVKQISISLGVFHQSYYENERRAQIPFLLASQRPEASIAFHKGGLRKSRSEVLAYMAAHPGVWPDDVNAGPSQESPLVKSEAVLRTYYRWATKHKETGSAHERYEFQRTLIKLGADLNGGQDGHNLLQACIPDTGADLPLDLADLDHAISLGTDLHLQGPAAWARAIRNDVSARRYAKNAGLGPRCQALLDRGIPLHSPTDMLEYFSPLAAAVETGHLGLVRTLITQGVDPCWEDPKTKRNLISSNPKATGTCFAALKLFPLGAFKPVIDHLNSYGDTALHASVNELNAPLVELVLDHGANIDAENKKGKKPMQAMNRSGKAAMAKFDNLIALMIDRGADLGAEKNATSMHKAAVMLSVPAMIKLIDQGHGADLFKTDHSKRTPLEMAVRGHQSNASSQYDPVRGERQVNTVKFMMEQGVDIKAPFHSGNTALHSAVSRRCHLLVQFLLEQGMDPYMQNKEGKAPFQKWGSGFYPEQDKKNAIHIQGMVEAFINAGMDPQLPDNEGKLPFHELREHPWFVSLMQSIELRAATTQATPASRRLRL